MNLCQQNPSIKYCRGTGYASGRKLTCSPQKNTLWNPFHSMADSDNCRSNFNIPACECKYRLSFPCISDQWVMVKWILSFSLIILYYIVLVFFLANKRLSLNKQMCQLFRVKKLKKKILSHVFLKCLYSLHFLWWNNLGRVTLIQKKVTYICFTWNSLKCEMYIGKNNSTHTFIILFYYLRT